MPAGTRSPSDPRERPAAARYWAVVPAAGIGSRMGGELPKQYLPLCARPVLEHTLQRLASVRRLSGIVVCVRADDARWGQLALPEHLPVLRAPGGAERCHSVLNGLDRLAAELAAPDDWVLVHDAARPCVRGADIERLIDALAGHPVGGLLGLPLADTLKRADGQGNVLQTVDRSGLWRALTPQMFRLGVLREALRAALDAGALVTDEAAAVERSGAAPRMVAGHPDNIKITHREDLELAALYLQQQALAP